MSIVASALGSRNAIVITFLAFAALVALKQLLLVTDQPVKPREDDASKSISRHSLGVLRQILDGVLVLKSDRTIGLLILNTLVTNMLIYPCGAIVFPVIFKAIPSGAMEQEGSTMSIIILRLQSVVGITKGKAWMNYAALVGLGGAIGPIISNVLVYGIKTIATRRPQETNWIGLNCGMIGQLVTLLPLVVVLHFVTSLSAGGSILLMFVTWSAHAAMNNVTTIYFNAHAQHRLGREARGSFIANILTLFTLANSIGSLVYGWALASGSADAQIATSVRILSVSVAARFILFILLHSDASGRETMLLRKSP